MGTKVNGTQHDLGIRQATHDLSYKLYDDAAISIIKGMDLLTLYARSAGLLTAANMLEDSKEDISCWVAEQKFHEYTQHPAVTNTTSTGILVLFEALIDYLGQATK